MTEASPRSSVVTLQFLLSTWELSGPNPLDPNFQRDSTQIYAPVGARTAATERDIFRSSRAG